MVPHFDLATGIVQSVSCLLKDEYLADFIVQIDETYFRCHRFILGACSRFFYAMFTSDMKEKNDNTAQLHEIDLSAFDLILKVLYTGEDVVNEENVISIWQAAHRLQIPFLVSHCEKVLVSVLSLENYAESYRMARIFYSKPVLGGIKEFMLKNFKKVKDDEFFPELNADELIELIQSDELNVTSEDDVLFSIFKWLELSPDKELSCTSENENNDYNFKITDMPAHTSTNETVLVSKVELNPETQKNDTFSKSIQNRSVHLKSLLTASRSCLASLCCLKTLYHHPLTQSDEGAKNVIINAMLYQGKGYRHGYYTKAALHRNCSDFEHVGVIAYDTGLFEALSLARKKWYPMTKCKLIKNKIKIALFDSTLYAVGQADALSSKLCVLKGSTWVSIAELPGLGYFLLSHESFLYVFNASDGKVLRMQPNVYDKSLQNLEVHTDITHVEFALSFNEYILVFSKASHDGKVETAVHVMNSRNETWHRVKNIDGPAKNMASFQDGDKVYLLQNNGSLWSLSTNNGQMISFSFINKLWDVKESLRGALLYKGKLFLFLKLPWVHPSGKLMPSLPSIYTGLHRSARNGYASNFISTIMHKKDLIKK